MYGYIFLCYPFSVSTQEFRDQVEPGGYIPCPTCNECVVKMSVSATSVFDSSNQAFVPFYFPTMRDLRLHGRKAELATHALYHAAGNSAGHSF